MSTIDNSECFIDVFSTYSQQQAELRVEKRSSATVFENVNESEITGFTNDQIRQWLYHGTSPFSQSPGGAVQLISRSRSVSIGSDRMREQMPPTESEEVFENVKREQKIVGASKEEISRWIQGGRLPKIDPKRWKLNENNAKFLLGDVSREEAEQRLKSLGPCSFLLYEEEHAQLVFLYLSRRLFFHRFPVRRCRVMNPLAQQSGEWWSSRESFAILPHETMFSDINDLVSYYAEAICTGKRECSNSDPFEKVCADFEGFEACQMHKMVYKRCCGGRFHTNVNRFT
uniref:SH2 domain-containing protein n=1 Tax=Steinernema glaseri TaxID=37863 RepID=A0A1I7Z038_9BILA